jgi:hypothetical protein
LLEGPKPTAGCSANGRRRYIYIHKANVTALVRFWQYAKISSVLKPSTLHKSNVCSSKWQPKTIKIKTANMRGITVTEHQQQSLDTYETANFRSQYQHSCLKHGFHPYTNVMSGHTSHQNIAQFIPFFYSTCVY